MIRSLAAASICLVGLACATPGAPRSQWHVVTSPNFEIFSNLSESKSLELASELELFRALIALLSSDVKLDAPVPTKIYAFRLKSEFKRHALRQGSSAAGYFSDGIRNNTIALVDHSSRMGASEIILHEYVHFVVNGSSPRSYPAWYNEGFAELLSTARVHEDMIAVGAVPEARIPAFQYGEWLSMERVVSTDSLAALSPEQVGMFYAEAWALVHYLTLDREDNGSMVRDLEHYLSLVELGAKPAEAFEHAFRESPRRAGMLIRRNLKRGDLRVLGIPLAKLSVDRRPPTSRVPPPDEVHVRLGQISLFAAKFERAEKQFRAAVARNPASARAQAGLGDALKFQGRMVEAEEYFRRAVELAPEDLLVRLDLGEYLFARALDEEPSEAGRLSDLEAARAAFERAVELAPENAEALSMLGATWLLPGEDAQKALPWVAKAYARLPSSQQAAEQYVHALVATGDDRSASKILTRMLASRVEGSLQAGVEERIERIRTERKDRLERVGPIRAASAH